MSTARPDLPPPWPPTTMVRAAVIAYLPALMIAVAFRDLGGDR